VTAGSFSAISGRNADHGNHRRLCRARSITSRAFSGANLQPHRERHGRLVCHHRLDRQQHQRRGRSWRIQSDRRQYALIWTGAGVDTSYTGGVGHYLEEIERQKRLNAITRKIPGPVDRRTIPRFEPLRAPPSAPAAPAIPPQPMAAIQRPAHGDEEAVLLLAAAQADIARHQEANAAMKRPFYFSLADAG
jgi:hypothetical protein